MAGRKRKTGAREPNGRIERKSEETKFAPAAIKRLADNAIALASDPRLGTEAGRLLLSGKLTARQAGAAWRWSEIAADYARAIEAPTVKTATLERAAKSAAPEEGTAAAESLNKALARAVSRYRRARDLLDARGADVSRQTRLIAEGTGVALLTHEQFLQARDGLDALAALFATGRDGAAQR